MYARVHVYVCTCVRKERKRKRRRRRQRIGVGRFSHTHHEKTRGMHGGPSLPTLKSNSSFSALFCGNAKGRSNHIKIRVCLLTHSVVSSSFLTPWIVALPVSSVGFLRQEYWSGWLFPSPGDHLNPGIEPKSPELQADSDSEPPGHTEPI